MSTSSENIPNVSFPGDVELPFKSAPYTLHTSDGKDGDPAVDWTVTHHPDRHRINPEVASLPARYRWRVVAAWRLSGTEQTGYVPGGAPLGRLARVR